MAIHLVHAGRHLPVLWDAAVHDSGCVAVAATPCPGGDFTSLLADALAQTGRIEPHPRRPRLTFRNEIGRVQVGLTATQADLAVVAAERLAPADLRLIATAAARASVDTWLINTQPMPTDAHRALTELGSINVDPSDALDAWTRRPTADGRRHPWQCHAALDGAHPGPSCDLHPDTVDCLLTWARHAIATGRAHPDAVRSRLHQVATRDSDAFWRTAAVARDPTPYADRALHDSGVDPRTRERLTLADCLPDGTAAKARRGWIPITKPAAGAVAAQRAIRLADGYQPGEELLAVSNTTVYRYRNAKTTGTTARAVQQTA